MRLKEHSRISIIGGGPAGSFAALQLLRVSELNHLQLEVRIFEPRNFARPGPSGCNRCAGILSSRLWGNMSELGLSIPDEVIQADLIAYTIHLNGETIQLDRPDPSRRIVSVYRGGGPRMIEGTPVASFDDFLIHQAIQRGAIHIQHRVHQVTWDGIPTVYTRLEQYPSDFVILAIGINSKSPLAPAFGYRPPKTEVMAQDEVLRPENWAPGEVHAYFQRPARLNFGAIIPKGRFLNISLLGKGFTRDTVDEFISAQNLAGILGYDPSGSMCGCNPRIAVGRARNYYGDRWVAVGDAAVTRLYKDGIGSAYQTTKNAISTAMDYGISQHAFKEHYAPVCQSIANDNRYGFLLFRLWNYVLKSPRILNIWKGTIQRELALPVSRRLHTRLLWGMLTGDEPYRRLFYGGMNPMALLHLSYGINHTWR